MENPCIECIVLAMCKARAAKGEHMFIAWAGARCTLYQNYVMKSSHTFHWKRVNELGELFGYEITDEGGSCRIRAKNVC